MKHTTLLLAIIFMSASVLSGQSSGSVGGIWLGTLKLPSAQLRIAITITGSEHGNLEAVMTSIDQGGVEIPMDEAILEDDTLIVTASVLGVHIKGAIDPVSETWETIFKQGPAVLPLILKKTDKIPGQKRPQEPASPVSYNIEDVEYENSESNITISGTLTLPRGEGPFPAVVLLTGSGAQNRDSELFGHKPFLVLADYLTRQGIAVLRSDDRGVGGTTGSFAISTTEDFAKDALAGIAFLQGRTVIDPAMTGLVGHSEGGMMAPLAATRSDQVGFIVLMAAPAIPFDQIVLYQKKRQWNQAGMSQDDIELNTAWHNQVTALVTSNRTNQQVREEMEKMFENLTGDERTRMYKTKENLAVEIEIMASNWWRFAANYDAMATLRHVQCPVLAINGEKDTQVTAKENLTAIKEALNEGNNPNYFVRNIAGLNHLFQTAETGDVLEYGNIEETFSPVAMKVVADWILDL